MDGVFGNEPLQVPDWPTLPTAADTSLPTGAGTTLPVAPELFPEIAKTDEFAGAPASAQPGIFGISRGTLDEIAYWAKAVEDAVNAFQGKEATGAQKFLAGRRATRTEERAQRTEQRKAVTEEERLRLEQSREARAIRTEQGQAFDAVAKSASDLAPTVMTIPDAQKREKTITAFVEAARARGGDRAAIVAQSFLRNPEIGQMFGPLMRDLPAEGAEGIRQLAVAASFKNELGVGLEHGQRLALTTTNAKLLNQMRAVSGVLRDQYAAKGGIPIGVLEAAIQTADPGDAPGTNPQLNLLRGLGPVYGQETVTKRVRSNLAELGFQVPDVAAKVAEVKATEVAKREVEYDPAFLMKETQKAYTMSRAKTSGEITARVQAGELSPTMKELGEPVRTRLLGQGVADPTPKQIAEADLWVRSQGDEQAIARTLKGSAVKEMGSREGAKAGKPSKLNPLFENIKDEDVRLLATQDESALGQILRALGGGGGGTGKLKNGLSFDENVAKLKTSGMSPQKATEEVKRLQREGKL